MIVFAADLFASDYIGGAELTLEALVEKCPFPYERILTTRIDKSFIDQHKDKFWKYSRNVTRPSFICSQKFKLFGDRV